MKKILLTMMTIAVLGIAWTSCSKGDPYDPTRKDKDSYDRLFLSYVGGTIHPDQDWGFGATARKASSRGQETGFFVDDFDKAHADAFTEDFYKETIGYLPLNTKVTESDIVMTNYEFVSTGDTYFDIFFSDTKADIEIGYYYYNPDGQKTSDRKEVKLVGAFATDQPVQGYFRYFNSQDRERTPAADYGEKVWIAAGDGQTWCRQFHIEPGDIPAGYRFGLYTKNNGVTSYTNKFLNASDDPRLAIVNGTKVKTAFSNINTSYIVGLEDGADSDCNDILISIVEANQKQLPQIVVPEKEPEPTPVAWYRVLAEDLNVTGENSDFDFNDIVLDVALTADGADCILQAAGATLPIRINGNDALEVHKLFGVAGDVMVNTNAESKGLKGATRAPYSFSISGSFSTVNDVRLEVQKNGTWIELRATRGEPACKICVNKDFQYPSEQESLKAKYPDFIGWVQNLSDWAGSIK